MNVRILAFGSRRLFPVMLTSHGQESASEARPIRKQSRTIKEDRNTMIGHNDRSGFRRKIHATGLSICCCVRAWKSIQRDLGTPKALAGPASTILQPGEVNKSVQPFVGDAVGLRGCYWPLRAHVVLRTKFVSILLLEMACKVGILYRIRGCLPNSFKRFAIIQLNNVRTPSSHRRTCPYLIEWTIFSTGFI